jgi:Purple acid Phosphatase, N-terminal domain
MSILRAALCVIRSDKKISTRALWNPYTIFRVRIADLSPKTTYYYKVDSMEAKGRGDGVFSPVKKFTTPQLSSDGCPAHGSNSQRRRIKWMIME